MSPVEKPKLAEGQELLRDYEHQAAAYRNAARYVLPPNDHALRQWLWDHRFALIGALAELEGTRLQVESRDRTIIGLLQTLRDTEQRLPGITAPPKR